ncbi:UTP--glucose-1-phosphate uridylyltransferase [Ancrocorticia populi]|uniref:UTP--glucose-1-phosphate uridylyltransferase n=1 Tax=Ancrocorticia populi TaxID=2175228 RepID=UPI002357446F|nr:UTP--glucose-1-phosphate uridylyltransferase [Ancrocorticia populi]
MTEPAAIAKMRAHGKTEAEIADFSRAFNRVYSGERTLIPERMIDPLTSIRSLSSLETPQDAAQAISHTAVLKLNGGIGTTMGLNGPKSLLEAHEGRTFLDIALGQILWLREHYQIPLPFILLNSDATASATQKALGAHNAPTDGIPSTVLQTVVPRLDPDTYEPISWPADPPQEWAPPGHGDLYGVLVRTGLLDLLLEKGYSYLFVANADNLGAVPDPTIASWFDHTGADFAAEVVRRTPMDTKGGHFARRISDDGIVLRELAQTPESDLPFFMDIQRHAFLNTNNLWINLASLKQVYENGGLALPVIVNHKTVGHKVPAIQIESAMGSAIGNFAHAELLEVDNTRFIPVKRMADLMLLRSDAFELTPEGIIKDRAPQRPIVDLDPRYFARYEDFAARVPETPSLLRAHSLTVRGDVRIAPGYVAEGNAQIIEDEPEA